MNLNNNLKAIRKKKGLSQQEVAEYLGIDTTSYGRLERGDRKISADRLNKLASYYNTTISNLIDGLNESIDNNKLNESTIDIIEYLKLENAFLRSSLKAKDEQLNFFIELVKEYKK